MRAEFFIRSLAAPIASLALLCFTDSSAAAKAPLAPDPVLSILQSRSPLEERATQISKLGANGNRRLVSVIFDESQPMRMRWLAVTTAGKVAGKAVVPDLEKALKSPEWFLRNAALLALTDIDEGKALDWSRKLLRDRSLIVRGAAVDTIHEFRDSASASLLWRELGATDNFRGGKSLFIRKHILEALADIEGRDKTAKFIQVLGDKDRDIHATAIAALEKITGETLGGARATIEVKRALWMKWGRTH